MIQLLKTLKWALRSAPEVEGISNEPKSWEGLEASEVILYEELAAGMQSAALTRCEEINKAQGLIFVVVQAAL